MDDAFKYNIQFVKLGNHSGKEGRRRMTHYLKLLTQKRESKKNGRLHLLEVLYTCVMSKFLK